MPTWMIEAFGSAQLNRAFWLILLIPLPAWITMIAWGSHSVVYKTAHPLVLPLIAVPTWIYLLYQLIVVFGVPGITDAGFQGVRDFITHPVVFLVLLAQLQVVNLFVGVVIYREGYKARINVSGELILCWILAPLALVVCALRLGHRKFFK